MKTPENICDIQCFLGMLVYYRYFIPNFATIAKPLTLLLRDKILFNWGRTTTIEILKNSLVSTPLLVYLDFDKPFITQIDASFTAVAAILS